MGKGRKRRKKGKEERKDSLGFRSPNKVLKLPPAV
jgi:hypothetical protein